jgi:hypothetical protein
VILVHCLKFTVKGITLRGRGGEGKLISYERSKEELHFNSSARITEQ